MEKPIIIKIPLIKYLKEITKNWPAPYVTKTYGGQVWISDEDPGECFRDDLNSIEFDKSCAFFRLPKEVHQYIDLEPGCHKTLTEILKETR
ncbi:MAG TPA: hypothetical protein VN456_12300 [Desulfosporosinus sp.]|nr:hypothetical protein [Desulfosporosinus sp.]